MGDGSVVKIGLIGTFTAVAEVQEESRFISIGEVSSVHF